ncbi:hypothetical protein C4F50_10645 [Flavobacterium sp. KB82]|uniref:Uncharacterized protein n=2 Tax=Flavobacterium hungaricum TaxID=2082725 RepID=A0ABR9TJG0_9FLAO|nr:hypothetical protein [Flavobacterium hungaricum]
MHKRDACASLGKVKKWFRDVRRKIIMEDISEKFRKYLFKVLYKKESYFLVWGAYLETDEEFILRDKNDRILIFPDFITLKNYVNNEINMSELNDWVNSFKDISNVKIIDFDILSKLKNEKELNEKNIQIWHNLSILIEFYSDLLYINNEYLENASLEIFLEIYNNNFIWNNHSKTDFTIDKKFLIEVEKILSFLEQKILIIEPSSPKSSNEKLRKHL